MLSFSPLSLKDKNQGELIPPVLKFTVTYLREKGERGLAPAGGARAARGTALGGPSRVLSTPGQGIGGVGTHAGWVTRMGRAQAQSLQLWTLDLDCLDLNPGSAVY